LPSTASPVAVFVHTLGAGSKGAEVKALQAKLRELGFFKHPTNTGLFAAVTKAALVAFQKAEGLKASGSVDSATRDALNGVSAAPAAPVSSVASPVAVFRTQLKVGSRSNEVKALQAKLRELGFFDYPTDTGSFGAATRAAVMAFQKAQGLSQVGFVGPGTRAALNSL
jgi:peptidoglycan hydrolase-like protein with peptidoglycan-binding domain